ncbi:RluA family pseudouridine synthase [Bacteroidetes/Chlorobi group bacterium ChocPot_Mid]|jgi:23S rRNA pseudouridine1911/1915/1917 synthase|nr:MAG: RluA family pseudouridine synthase [Bacteroidetes/Chlorobi group bacterium ChocPot_Mid]
MLMNDENIENENYPDLIETVFEFNLPSGQKPERLDVFLTNSLKYATRNKIQKAIDDGCVTINGVVAKSSKKIQPNDKIICKILKPPPIKLIPEDIPLNILFEDEYLLVVNKPAGMVTHPGFGNRRGTIVNAILWHIGNREEIDIEIEEDEDSELNEEKIFSSEAIRPGIVHRLDKDTTGLLLITKDSSLHSILAKQFEERTVERYYYALVWGDMKNDSGTYEGDIGRNPRNRKTFAVVKKEGKPAITDYWVLERFGIMTLVKVKLRTGRTHQIRVHFSHNGHPVLGDKDYGGDVIVKGGGIPETKKLAERCLKIAERQMLHAKILGFTHPINFQRLSFESELPDDFEEILKILRVYCTNHV